MLSPDPAADWDRYCRDQEAPQPAGEPHKVRSKQDHICESCWNKIPAGTQHLMQPMVNDVGLFCSPLRLHLDGECQYPPEEDYS